MGIDRIESEKIKSDASRYVGFYSFCENVHAGPFSKWHIRKLTDTGYKCGGADTPSLCGKQVHWDLWVDITEFNLNNNTCKKCQEIFKTQGKGLI